MYPISKVLISNLAFVFQNVVPKYPVLGILGQKVLTFKSFGQKVLTFKSFNEISIVPYFEGADFKHLFSKMLSQMPNFGHFGPKSINFLIF